MPLILRADTEFWFPYKMFRSFWPVGQGAFYSELLTVKSGKRRGYDAETLVVYDCGSSDKRDYIDKCISRLEKQCKDRKIIDILFISHLHDDHISHIEDLLVNWNIRSIVLPVLSPEAIIEQFLQNYVRDGQPHPQVIQLFQTLFSMQEVGSTKIIRVSYASEEDHISDNESHSIESLSSGHIANLRSGVPIRSLLWEYIPCNYPTHHSSDLVDALKANYSALYQAFLNNDWLDIRYQLGLIPFADIAKLYDDTFDDQNEESMTVLSRPLVKTDPQRIATCLYTGDSPFRKEKRLQFIKKFYNQFWKIIGTIQASHHGSGIDNPQDLYDHPVKGVMCYGTTNGYHHPGIETFIHIATSNGDARVITERRTKPFVQPITFC